jgi:diguanylate cyclase (GGDEF)-like protein
MQTLTNERAKIVEEYVASAEQTLNFYSKASQITDLLKSENPAQNQELIDAAYEYTKAYSADIPNLEGIYVSEWNTHVLAQTNFKYPDTNMVTRKDETSLRELQDALIAAGPDGMYNVGMIVSPASGKQIVSLYKGIFDEHDNPIGIVGLGIYSQGVVDNLNSLKAIGMDGISYAMVSAENYKFVFYPIPEIIGTTAESKEIQEICADLLSGSDKDEGTYEFPMDGETYVGCYKYLPKYKWLLMVNDNKNEIYAVSRNLRTYMLLFLALIVGVVSVFAYLNKRQEKINAKLASTIVKNNKTKDSLYTAMFKDVLTDVSNRIAFSMELDEVKPTSSDPYYFIMFNIAGFSDVNTRYGNDVGDWVLVRTVDILKQVFKNSNIYRTGSDEFVVALQVREKDVTADNILDDAKDAYERLTSEQNTSAGKIKFEFKAAVVKKTGAINTSLITILKDLINKNPEASLGRINYSDLSR